MGLFSTVYTDSMTVPDGSSPSMDPTTIGAGTTPQTPTGVRHTDNFDDRVSYEASYYTDVPQAQTILLGNDLDASGTQSLSLWGRVIQALNPTRSANLAPRSQVDSVIQNVGHGGSFSEETWRPYAGLPISGTSDAQWTHDTGIYVTQDVDKEWQLLVDQNMMQLPERARGHPMRLSGHPSTGQPNRPWDVEMGAWPWTGEHSAQRPPVAGQPFNDLDPINHALPAPTGAGGPVYMVNNLAPSFLTFRTAPSPWDVQTDGTFVDSGT